jgi:hypothetical protein
MLQKKTKIEKQKQNMDITINNKALNLNRNQQNLKPLIETNKTLNLNRNQQNLKPLIETNKTLNHKASLQTREIV